MARDAWNGIGERNVGDKVNEADAPAFPVPKGWDAQDASRVLSYLQLEILRSDSYCVPLKSVIGKMMKDKRVNSFFIFKTEGVDELIDWMVRSGRCDRIFIDNVGIVLTATKQYVDSLPESMRHIGQNREAREYSGLYKLEKNPAGFAEQDIGSGVKS